MRNLHNKSGAQRAQMAMMLEVCAHPKPGNVDRNHDYEDTWLEHFLASAIFAKPAFERAEKRDGSVGELIKEAVALTNSHKGGNTHFGAFILLIPLVMGGDIEGAKRVIASTTVSDAIYFYEAFGLTQVRMNETDDLDVNDPAAADKLRRQGMTLLNVMEYSADGDMVTREWTNGFALTQRVVLLLKRSANGRKGIVDAFFHLLSTETDTFIVKKHGRDVARWTMEQARDVVEGRRDIEEFDRQCRNEGINPGSIADIIIAGIYVALGEGWEWDLA
ncbi:MAG: triphosphoribosyl-dephospho-CoA synthase [Methanogenium sp.]|nr:triphosphoribosyl-dephospho-CoA synthase [Methanogenium sp.]